jgi:hypothetical protein
MVKKLHSQPSQLPISKTPTQGGTSRIAKDFMNQGKKLLRCLRTTEANTLTKEEIRMLRRQLHLLDIEASNRAWEPE